MMEILLTSATPLEVMAGKVVGLGVLGLAQMLVWASSVAILGPRVAERFSAAGDLAVDGSLVVWAAIFFVAGCFVIGVISAGIGAATTSLHEARQLFLPIALPAYVPLFLWQVLIEDPDGPLARVLSFIPMTSALTMMLRLGATDIALWETLASLAVTIAGGAVLLWGAARVFRAGLLMYGQRMTVRRILTTLRQAG
tara:strand:- start:194 stop:784 length:591 start_codon:yes stop_codon:yes gene_type:complete